MITITYVIQDEIGIHARPAGMLAKLCKELSSKVTIEANGKTVDATRLMQVMTLGATKGTSLVVKVEGTEEDADAKHLREFLKENL